MAYELIGKIKRIEDLQTFPSGFTKRECVVTTEADRFPQDIKLECVREKTELLAGFSVGEKVRVGFDLRGSEYKGRYYVNLVAWRLERVLDGGGAGGRGPTADGDDDFVPEDTSDYGKGDDVPF